MKYLNKPVAYLQDFDFDKNGKLINKNIPTDKPVIIMIQGNFCGYCTQAKPAFQKLAEKHIGQIFCATIQGDGNEKGESDLAKRLNSVLPGFRGFPEYVMYKNGKRVKKHEGGRTMEALESFVLNNS